MNTPSQTPGICRVDQPGKRTHGFFVRLQRQRKIRSAFFSDKQHGGREPAFAAAQAHYQKLQAKFGPPKRRARRWWAQIQRRKGRSGILGVQRIVARRGQWVRNYWVATWSPEPYVARRKVFAIERYGSRKARRLAIRARRAGLRSMNEGSSPVSF